jgi:hypothetical protein
LCILCWKLKSLSQIWYCQFWLILICICTNLTISNNLGCTVSFPDWEVIEISLCEPHLYAERDKFHFMENVVYHLFHPGSLANPNLFSDAQNSLTKMGFCLTNEYYSVQIYIFEIQTWIQNRILWYLVLMVHLSRFFSFLMQILDPSAGASLS